MRALKAKKIVGATYFVGKINDLFANYFKEAGFDVLGMDGIDVPFDKVGQLSPEEVYAHVKRVFLKHRRADAIYLLGTGWRVLPVDRSPGAGSRRAGGASGAGALLGNPAPAFDPSAGEGLWSLAGRDVSGVNEGRRECGSVAFRGHVGTTRQELDWKAFQSGRSSTDFQSELTRKAPAGHLLRRPRESEDPYPQQVARIDCSPDERSDIRG